MFSWRLGRAANGMRCFLGRSAAQPRKITISLAVPQNSQENALFYWQSPKQPRKKYYFIGSALKLPRKCRAFMVAKKIRYGIIFSWLFIESAKKILYFLAVQLLAAKKTSSRRGKPSLV